MGENSTILSLLLSERLEEANTVLQDWRGPSPFQRFSTNLRKSFNKLTSLRNKYSIEDKRVVGEQVTQLAHVPSHLRQGGSAKRGAEDRESLDSGVETDDNSEAAAGDNSVLPGPTAGQLTIAQTYHDDVTTAHGVQLTDEFPSLSASGGALLPPASGPEDLTTCRPPVGPPGNRLPSGCLVTRRAAPQAHLPKKKVSIRLPEESSRATVSSLPQFPVDLRVVRVQVLESRDHRRSLTAAPVTIRDQSQSILVSAHQELTSRAPELCDTVQLVFQPGLATPPYLASLSSEDMWRLMLHLELLLFSGLLVDVPYFETSLFMVHSFLLSLSNAIQSLGSGFEHFPACFRDLVSMCQRVNYADHAVCLADTQSLFLVFGRAVVSHLSANTEPVSATSKNAVLHSSASSDSMGSQASSANPMTLVPQSSSTNPTRVFQTTYDV